MQTAARFSFQYVIITKSSGWRFNHLSRLLSSPLRASAARTDHLEEAWQGAALPQFCGHPGAQGDNPSQIPMVALTWSYHCSKFKLLLLKPSLVFLPLLKIQIALFQAQPVFSPYKGGRWVCVAGLSPAQDAQRQNFILRRG